jgi:hypothetical protein
VTNCEVRKYSASIEYAHCMSGYLDIYVNVHHWHDDFRHRLWWIMVYFFIGVKVVICLLSKNNGGNDVTSHVLLSLMLF